jgi:DMSO/TMAO reductase YedYZ molybdopterin-dependent catalytic subunit
MAKPPNLDRLISRRQALALGVAATAGALVPPRWVSAAAGDAKLVLRNARPLDAESPIEALRTFETPNDLFFVRSHHALPPESKAPWTLSIDGEVAHPVTLSLDDIRRLRAERRSVTLECAGNGRGRFNLSPTSGVQWGVGAVSTATWTGVPLATLLDRAGVQAGAQHFWMEAADGAPIAAAPKFLRSIPREIALAEAFVAYEMNGRPVPFLHGGPLRLITPRWFGMASTKWLTHVHARATESDNHFMARGYRYADGSPVDLMRVKSLITTPRDGDQIASGTTRVTGVAWTGSGTVSQVDVSIDEGKTWQAARLTSEAKPGVWRQWEASVSVRSPGDQRLRVRATDSAGNTQPEKAASNPGGYGNNSIHEVTIHAR